VGWNYLVDLEGIKIWVDWVKGSLTSRVSNKVIFIQTLPLPTAYDIVWVEEPSDLGLKATDGPGSR
jgi:hypothetical protein